MLRLFKMDEKIWFQTKQINSLTNRSYFIQCTIKSKTIKILVNDFQATHYGTENLKITTVCQRSIR